MAKNTQAGAKSLRKATKRAKVRAAPLLSGHAKKTTLARPASKKPHSADRRTPAERLRETIEEIRARTAMPASTGKLHEEPANRAGIPAPGTGIALGAAHQVVDAMPRAAKMTFMPLGMMVRQQALTFGLMLDLLQIQRQVFDMWRPRYR